MSPSDLSSTGLVSLPTAGLEVLEELRLEDAWGVKTFPSVYAFASIQRASLTYHHHCCAFRWVVGTGPAGREPENLRPTAGARIRP